MMTDETLLPLNYQDSDGKLRCRFDSQGKKGNQNVTSWTPVNLPNTFSQGLSGGSTAENEVL